MNKMERFIKDLEERGIPQEECRNVEGLCNCWIEDINGNITWKCPHYDKCNTP